MPRTINRILVPAVALLVACLSVSAWAKKDELPKTTDDGMELVEHTDMRAVYKMPDASLAQYTKVSLVECAVAFEKNWQRDYNRNERSLQMRIDDKDMERMKSTLAEAFTKEFTKVLEEKGHEVVTEAGPDVLVVRPAIVNLQVAAPDKMSSARNRQFVASAVAMTIYLEFYDSVSGAILGKAMDPQVSPRSGTQIANRATNKGAADALLRQWAEELAEHLAVAQQAD